MTDAVRRFQLVLPPEIAAIAWDGTNMTDLADFLGGCFRIIRGHAEVRTEGNWAPLHLGDYAYIAPGAVIGVLNPAEMAAAFKETAVLA